MLYIESFFNNFSKLGKNAEKKRSLVYIVALMKRLILFFSILSSLLFPQERHEIEVQGEKIPSSFDTKREVLIIEKIFPEVISLTESAAANKLHRQYEFCLKRNFSGLPF
jgi:hypothetical protein